MSGFTEKPALTNNSPLHQPTTTTTFIDEVNKPSEVDDNTSHQSTRKASLYESNSSTFVEEEKNKMDMDDTSPGNTLEQEDPKKPTPPGSPQPTQEAQPQNKVADTLNDTDQPIKVTAPSVEKETPKVSTTNIASLKTNLLSRKK